MTIGQVIQGLSADDNRRDFWLRIMSHIELGRESMACELIADHRHDDDYEQQCVLLVEEIARQRKKKD